MSFGLRIENPGGVLVLDSDAVHYRYHSSPSPAAAGSIGSSEHTPYRFQVTLPDASHVPLVFVRPEANRVVAIRNIELVSGSTWNIWVWATNFAASVSQRNATVFAPVIFVFCPMTSSGQSFGMQLFRSNGTLSFDTGFRPLVMRQAVSYAQVTGNWSAPFPNPYTGQAGYGQFVNGQDATIAANTMTAVAGDARGTGDVTLTSSSETADKWAWGWMLVNSTTLRRQRIWWATDKPSFDLDASLAAAPGGTDLTVDSTLLPATALIIEAAGL